MTGRLPIKGYEDLYHINTEGDVISLGNKSNHLEEKILKPKIDKDGYRVFRLSKDNVKKDFRGCRLMAITFIPNPLNLEFVNHINSNRADDTLSNLEWITAYGNWKHGHISKVKPEKAVLKLEKYTDKIVCEYKSLMEAARDVGINQGNITNCIKGRCKSTGGFSWKLKEVL